MYTQLTGITPAQTEQLAQKIAMQTNLSCEVRELPSDLHEMFLAAPNAFHLVLRPPHAAKQKHWSDPKGWLAQGEAYYAYIEKLPHDKEPSYIYRASYTNRVNPASDEALSYNRGAAASPPPSAEQQARIDRVLDDWQPDRI